MSIWLEEEKLIRIAIHSHEVVAVDSSFGRRRFKSDPSHQSYSANAQWLLRLRF